MSGLFVFHTNDIAKKRRCINFTNMINTGLPSINPLISLWKYHDHAIDEMWIIEWDKDTMLTHYTAAIIKTAIDVYKLL